MLIYILAGGTLKWISTPFWKPVAPACSCADAQSMLVYLRSQAHLEGRQRLGDLILQVGGILIAEQLIGVLILLKVRQQTRSIRQHRVLVRRVHHACREGCAMLRFPGIALCWTGMVVTRPGDVVQSMPSANGSMPTTSHSRLSAGHTPRQCITATADTLRS